jgi:hypothetical protein
LARQLNELAGFLIPYRATGESSPRFASFRGLAEAKGQRAADRIEHLEKRDMAAEAETRLADTGGLPEPAARAARDRLNHPSTLTKTTGRRTGRRRNGATAGHEVVVVELERTNDGEPATSIRGHMTHAHI